ncbi:MAG TPA: sugar phosphate isomerase/epimerase [Fibrobacteria bacterium]|nr:sugar phosphate isomerase/epimerase [Fibrobacteria bacterium]
MKFSMNMLLWTDNALGEEYLPVMERLKAMGYDGIELPVFDPQPDKYAALGKRLDALGLARTAVTVSGKDANPISPDARIRARAVETLKKTLDCCRAGGMELLVGPFYSPLGEFTGQGPTKEEWNRGAESLRAVAEYARQLGVGLALEPLNRFEVYFLNTAADAARFAREIGIPGCGTLYDTFHANIEEKSIAKALEAAADTVRHVHISENDRSTPGSGGVNWSETFRSLKAIGYGGWLTIEAFGTSMPILAATTKIWRRMYQDEDQLARDGLAFMKKMAAV